MSLSEHASSTFEAYDSILKRVKARVSEGIKDIAWEESDEAIFEVESPLLMKNTLPELPAPMEEEIEIIGQECVFKISELENMFLEEQKKSEIMVQLYENFSSNRINQRDMQITTEALTPNLTNEYKISESSAKYERFMPLNTPVLDFASFE